MLQLQEWKLILDAAAYERNIDTNMSKNSDEKEIDRHDSNLYWPASIKYTIQWFHFHAIMEHTANTLNPKKGIIPSLLKLFSMFELRLNYYRYRVEDISSRCNKCRKETGLYLGTLILEGTITKSL